MAKDPDVVALSYSDILKVKGRVSHDAECIVWDGGDTEADYPGWLTAEATCEVLSGSADDAVGGGGATKVTIVGQGDDGLEISEEITLTGGSAVELTNSYKIIYLIYISATEDTSPLTGPNHGLITARKKTGPVNMAKILATYGSSLSLLYRVPSNKYAELIDARLYSPVRSFIRIIKRSSVTAPWNIVATMDLLHQESSLLHAVPDFIAPGEDIAVLVTPSAAADISGYLGFKLYTL